MTEQQQENMKKWIAALRSDEYAQGEGALRQQINGQDRFCCLGVACDLYARDPEVKAECKWIIGGAKPVDFNLFSVAGSDSLKEYVEIPPDEVVAYFSDDISTRHLMDMNDTIGNSFSEIADYLEKELFEY